MVAKYVVENQMQIERIVRKILDSEAEAIKAVSIDESYSVAIEFMSKCEGKIITTGMGKAGFVAHKFAAILSSTATPLFLSILQRQRTETLGCLRQATVLLLFQQVEKRVRY